MPPTFNKNADWQAISAAFLALHEQDGFAILPPSSMLHDSVPMSFVMSAGLIQVENELEQVLQETRGQFVFTQPCFRHFDVSQVATDSTHLSLFHMSAAFHIGCSQRETVLPRLWFFLTQVLQLDPAHLWISYLDDPEFGRDAASYQCWRNIGVLEQHLIGLDQQHCFWRQRSTGQIASDGKKCGPHTEVFYERPEVECKQCNGITPPLGQCRCGRFVEISNTLFIENYINASGELIAAPTVFAECVVGLERLAMVLQQATDVYHIQRFQEWRDRLNSILHFTLDSLQNKAINLILDHLSAFAHLVADGAPAPGRGGRARIMRNLVRGAMTQIILYDWVFEDVVAALFVEPEQQKCLRLLRDEYVIFSRTVTRGRRKLQALCQRNALSQSMWERLEKEWGMPRVLLDKFYQQYLADCDISLNQHKR